MCASEYLNVSFEYVSSDSVFSYQTLPTSFEPTLFDTHRSQMVQEASQILVDYEVSLNNIIIKGNLEL